MADGGRTGGGQAPSRSGPQGRAEVCGGVSVAKMIGDVGGQLLRSRWSAGGEHRFTPGRGLGGEPFDPSVDLESQLKRTPAIPAQGVEIGRLYAAGSLAGRTFRGRHSWPPPPPLVASAPAGKAAAPAPSVWEGITCLNWLAPTGPSLGPWPAVRPPRGRVGSWETQLAKKLSPRSAAHWTARLIISSAAAPGHPPFSGLRPPQPQPAYRPPHFLV